MLQFYNLIREFSNAIMRPLGLYSWKRQFPVVLSGSIVLVLLYISLTYIKTSIKLRETTGKLVLLGNKQTISGHIPEVDNFIKHYKEKLLNHSQVYCFNDLEPYTEFIARLKMFKKSGRRMDEFLKYKGSQSWSLFERNINQYFLYDPDDGTLLNDLLKDLNSRPVTKVENHPRTSQLALKLTFDDGGQGIFKPKRFPINAEPSEDVFFFSEFERHNAEIAAFHMDKVLGFHRAPPTVSRVLNISRDIQQHGDQILNQTVYTSPAGNLCFFGKCIDFCNPAFPICGRPVLVGGSVSVYLPNRSLTHFSQVIPHPWKRTYHMRYKSEWETNDDFCQKKVKTIARLQGRRLVDLMDTVVFDFLIGNMDRHDVEIFDQFGNDTFLIHYDHGRGFGRSKYDCMSCIAPVRQCCLIRLSTLAKLVKLYIGPDSLSHVLRESLKADPINPVLWEPHLDALDRRVGKILQVVSDCINKKGKPWREVVIDDGVV